MGTNKMKSEVKRVKKIVHKLRKIRLTMLVCFN